MCSRISEQSCRNLKQALTNQHIEIRVSATSVTFQTCTGTCISTSEFINAKNSLSNRTSLFVYLEQRIVMNSYSVGGAARLLAHARPRSVDCLKYIDK